MFQSSAIIHYEGFIRLDDLIDQLEKNEEMTIEEVIENLKSARSFVDALEVLK